jgi:RNA ligase (TIGR02306 family)
MASSSRKLASIQRVAALVPIEGADRLVVARIHDWSCVVAKDAFCVGDAVVYFEIDSLLPAEPRFEFLRAGGCFTRCQGVGEGFRIKTRRIRGAISQGLVMPLGDFADELARLGIALDARDALDAFVGRDLTSELRVLKYEVFSLPASLPAGAFPAFLCKTDQERVQNCFRKIASEHRADAFEVTLKLDGTSCTAFHLNGDTGVCSRNLLLKRGGDGGVYAHMGEPIAAALAARQLNVAVQMEIMGPKINKNREGFLVPRAFVFDVFCIDSQTYWTAPRRRALCAELGLDHVPVVAEAMTLEGFDSAAAVLAFAERPSIAHAVAEGVVFKCLAHPGVSFKAVSQAYLLKEA